MWYNKKYEFLTILAYLMYELYLLNIIRFFFKNFSIYSRKALFHTVAMRRTSLSGRVMIAQGVMVLN